MTRRCEICEGIENVGGSGSGSARLRRILVGERIVLLCDEHAAEYRLGSARSVDGLRSLFREPAGRRSLLSRRAPLDRRVFPPRPEGRRRSDGRRQSDRDT